MRNLAILLSILPLIAGVVAAFFNAKVHINRPLTKIFTLLNLGVDTYITWYVIEHGTVILETGSWVAPYGIILVADPLAVILVLTTNIIATACAFYAPHALSERSVERRVGIWV